MAKVRHSKRGRAAVRAYPLRSQPVRHLALRTYPDTREKRRPIVSMDRQWIGLLEISKRGDRYLCTLPIHATRSALCRIERVATR